jgi:hypothetical protein
VDDFRNCAADDRQASRRVLQIVQFAGAAQRNRIAAEAAELLFAAMRELGLTDANQPTVARRRTATLDRRLRLETVRSKLAMKREPKEESTTPARPLLRDLTALRAAAFGGCDPPLPALDRPP